jgi:DNA-binding NtrC family response regulator
MPRAGSECGVRHTIFQNLSTQVVALSSADDARRNGGGSRTSHFHPMSTRRQALTPTLVVEDDAVLRGAIRGALEDAGFHPIECADLKTAREKIERSHPLVVVLDLGLGDEFGVDLLEELAAREDAPAVVICSAFGLANLIAARYSVPCVRKPFEIDTLIREVERAADEKLCPRRQQTA